MRSNLSNEEIDILDAFESGKLKRIKRHKKEIIIAKDTAVNTIHKRKIISIRLIENENSK